MIWKAIVLRFTFFGLMFLAFMGCEKKSEFDRLTVTGSITWKGKRIPAGTIYFDPDVIKKNSGPQGVAMIKDGKFDTRFANSRGCVQGSHIATIHACDGKNKSESKPFGNKMFKPYTVEVEIPANGGEVNLVVPDSIIELKPSNESE